MANYILQQNRLVKSLSNVGTAIQMAALPEYLRKAAITNINAQKAIEARIRTGETPVKGGKITPLDLEKQKDKIATDIARNIKLQVGEISNITMNKALTKSLSIEDAKFVQKGLDYFGQDGTQKRLTDDFNKYKDILDKSTNVSFLSMIKLLARLVGITDAVAKASKSVAENTAPKIEPAQRFHAPPRIK